MNNMKKLFLLLFVLLSKISMADEGMWLPQLLAQLNEKQMKGLGMKISASDIYNINKGSLKDAIVSFGGFCTGEVISDKGLLLTNHHCGFDAVQNHSTIEHNYIRDGFWARNYGEEIPNPGLFVTFIVRIDEVTQSALKGVDRGLGEKERQSAIDKNIDALKKSFKRESYQDVLIKPFFEGNKYFLFVTETYRDVRLVGAPPSSIGNFGKDTDNWMWPRHTGDFSMFRMAHLETGDLFEAEYFMHHAGTVPKHHIPAGHFAHPGTQVLVGCKNDLLILWQTINNGLCIGTGANDITQRLDACAAVDIGNHDVIWVLFPEFFKQGRRTGFTQ